MLSHVVLGLLRDGESAHGYELTLRYRTRSGTGIASGSVYREVASLLRRGLIEPMPNPPGADARRQPYGITDRGRAQFDQWLTAPVDEDLDERVIFLGLLLPETRTRLFATWREQLSRRIRHLELQSPGVEDGALPARSGVVQLKEVLQSRRIRQLQAELAFLRDTEETMPIVAVGVQDPRWSEHRVARRQPAA